MINRYIMVTAIAFTFASCSKEIEVKSLNFDVTVSKTNGAVSNTYTTSDSLNFAFKGNPDVITFYSGEINRQYINKDRTVADGTPILQFTSLRATGTQANSLALMVSSDFKGIALKPGSTIRDTVTTNANIATAQWSDITSQAALSTGAATPSGEINLSSFANLGKPVYIAFKYVAAAGSVQNKWTITLLTLTNKLADESIYTIGNLGAPNTEIKNYGVITYSPGWWVSYDEVKNANKYPWVFTAGTSLVITGAATVGAATAPAEAWAIMGPINLKKVSPDVGVGLKSISAKFENYPYKYSSVTLSEPTFVASNNVVNSSATVVKPLSIKVTKP
ncbi:protein of unknown function [Pedobacter sp. ok626]|uniref:DUF5017 domain-containing protein n=1 Tax=Pedobacter sp. ok626 TaxID=1761882 RepID=UPI000892691A|nr:DUF5017 domain-containing protein [Pedobacter sp. ok626]SDL23214.1 protein of unknown function [Pedobacter sp. ok626]